MTANETLTTMKVCGAPDAPPTLESVRASAPTPLQTSLDFLTSLRAECLASLRVLSDSCAELPMSAGSGPRCCEWSASYDPGSRSLRTRQASLFSKEGEPGMESCRDWSRSGMICGGMYFPLERLVRGMNGKGCSSSVSLPTPRASANEARQTKLTPSQLAGTHGQSLQATVIHKMLPTPKANRNQACKISTRTETAGSSFDIPSLHTAVRNSLLPTPSARAYKDTPGMARRGTNPDGTKRERDDMLPRRIYGAACPAPTGGMRLTPEFLCWLMGYPPSWLRPLRDAPGMRSSRKC